jgi:hypothetical protein
MLQEMDGGRGARPGPDYFLTHSAAPSPAFSGRVKKRRSGSTLSKPRPSGRELKGVLTRENVLHVFYVDVDRWGEVLMKQNITLSIEKEVLKKAKLMAAKKETSVTKLLTEQLTKMVSEDEQYDLAKKRALTILKKGFHLGGCIMAEWEGLHERR